MVITRILEKQIVSSAKNYPVVFITGPRQSGKTTLSKQTFAKYYYQNLENPETRLTAQTDPKNFLSQSNNMIIDEIQRVPDLISYIQSIVDENPDKRYVITGSQNILISKKVSQSLAGRIAIFTLLPLSLKETENTHYKVKNIYNQIVRGFYPRIYDKNLNPIEWYPNYIQTYLERDIREIKNIINLMDFQRFLKLCAGRTGQIVNLSSLANDVGVSVNTIKGWLSILEATYIIYLLSPYYRNFNKRIIKSPKLYFFDVGLVCSLLSIKNENQLKTHPLFGSIYETFCASEILKQNYNNNTHINFYHWRDKNGNEIDLLYENNNELNTIEIKSSCTLNEDDSKNLYLFEKLTKSKVNKKLIYLSQEIKKYKDIYLQDWNSISI